MSRGLGLQVRATTLTREPELESQHGTMKQKGLYVSDLCSLSFLGSFPAFYKNERNNQLVESHKVNVCLYIRSELVYRGANAEVRQQEIMA